MASRGGRTLPAKALLLVLAAHPLARRPVEAAVSGRCDGGGSGPADSHLVDRLWTGDAGGACSAALAAVAVHAEVAGPLAHVVANHSYINDQAQAIEEASLTFAVPAGAALMGFQVHVQGGASARGEVRARSEESLPAACPRNTLTLGLYEASSTQGTHRVSVGKILPGERVHVQLEYAQELVAKPRPGGGAALQLAIPAPGGARRRAKDRDAPAAAASGVAATAAPLTVQLRVVPTGGAGEAAVEVSSPTSDVHVDVSAEGEGGLAATLTSKVFQDVMLEVAPPAAPEDSVAAQLFTPELVLQRRPATNKLAAALYLPAALAPGSYEAYELVLLLDRSASMRGTRLGRVQVATHSFIRSAPRSAKVNLLGLLAPARPLFEKASRELDREAFTLAESHVEAIPLADTVASAARGGGTTAVAAAMQPALAAVLEGLARDPGTQLRVLLVTDRHPPDTEEAIRYVAERCRGDCHLSAIGIGWGASPQFVEGIAKAGAGNAAFVAERGGAAALERTLTAQLEDALLPTVRNVQVDWGPLAPLAAGAAGIRLLPGASESAVAAVAGEADAKAFAAQGGLAEVLDVPLEPPALGAGGRLLALAFLGDASNWGKLSAAPPATLKVRAEVGGKQVVAEVPLPAELPPIGAAAHALAGAHLAGVLGADPRGERLGGGPNRKWQLQALGLAYMLATAQTHWVVATRRRSGSGAAAGGSEEGVLTLQGVHCSPQGRAEVGLHASAGTRAADVSAAGKVGAGPELSLRRPPSSVEAGQGFAFGVTSTGSLLSILDFTSLGSSLALRCFSSRLSVPRWAGGGIDPLCVASSLSLRNFHPFGRGGCSVLDFMHVGASLSLSTYRRMSQKIPKLDDLSKPWWQSDLDWGAPGFGEGDRLEFAGRAPSKVGAGESETTQVSTRDVCRLAASLSIVAPDPTAASRLANRLSILDFTQLGASLSLRTAGRPNAEVTQRLSTLSAMGYGYLGEHLSSNKDTLARRSAAARKGHGADDPDATFADGWGVRDDYEYEDGLGDMVGSFAAGRRERGASGTRDPVLSLRSFAKMSSALSATEAAAAGAMPDQARAAKVAERLAVLDFTRLGASLALRQPARPGAWGPRGAAAGAAGLPELSASLSVRTFGGDGLSIPPYRDAYAHEVGQGPLANDLWYADSGSEFGLGTRWPREDAGMGRGRGGGGEGPPGASSGPPAWISIGVAGGLLVPVLGLWRSGATCQPRHEAVRLAWPASAERGRAPAAVFVAAGPVAARGSAALRVGELPAPAASAAAAAEAKPSKGGKGRKPAAASAHELLVSLHVSHHCSLSAHVRHPSSSSTSGGAAAASAGVGDAFAAPLLEVDLPLESPPQEPADSAALRAALSAALAARRRERLPLQPRGSLDADGGADGGSGPAEPIEALAGEAASASSASTSAPSALGAGASPAGAVAAAEDPELAASYRALVRAQQFDGSFDLGGVPGGAWAAAGLQILHLDALAEAWALDASSPSAALARAAAHTAAALAALAARHGALRGAWSLLAAKAEAWLAAGPLGVTGCGQRPAECVEAADLAAVRWRR